MYATNTLRRTLAVSAAAISVIALAVLAACSPQAASDQSTDLSSTSGQCAWTAGYEINDEGLVETAEGDLVDVHDFCLTCHNDGDPSTGMEWDIVTKATADWKGEAGVNPHASHLGPTQCNLCHMEGHSLVMYCNNCHDMEL